MNIPNLRTVDLNLLTVFSAIYEYGHLTRAADALGMTQPAVSHALKRLRLQFDDPLFVRARARMEPTPRAHAIAGPVAESLDRIRGVLDTDRPFDPSAARREIRIGLLDYGITVFAPRIAAFVMDAAPNLRLDFRHTETEKAVAQIENGEIDLYIGPLGAPPAGYRKELLMTSEAVVAARRGHPAIGNGITLSEYCALDHVRFTNLTSIDREIDSILERRQMSRKSVIKVPHYSSALFVAARSDLVTTITRGPAALYGRFLDLELHELPFDLASSEISILRHPRTDSDPLVTWLWDHILTLRGAGGIA